MLRNLKQLKKLKIVLITSVILLLSSFPSYAQDKICFSPDTAKTMVVELDQARINNQIVESLKAENAELVKMTEILKEQIKLLNEKNDISVKMIAQQQELLKDSDKMCAEKLKAAKPSLMSELIKAAGILGAGIIIGLLL